jgi:hypothetical protein
MLINADIRTIQTILADSLPPAERREFVQQASDVSPSAFWDFVSGYFSDAEIKDAIAAFCTSQLENLEMFTGTRIDALITVAGRRYLFHNFYEEVS